MIRSLRKDLRMKLQEVEPNTLRYVVILALKIE